MRHSLDLAEAARQSRPVEVEIVLQSHHTAEEGTGPVVVRPSCLAEEDIGLAKEDVGLAVVLHNRRVGESHLVVVEEMDSDSNGPEVGHTQVALLVVHRSSWGCLGEVLRTT